MTEIHLQKSDSITRAVGERGESSPTAVLLEKLATGLGVPLASLFEAPVPGTKAGDIIEVMAEGFQLHDRLLRPAQVGVSSMPAQ